LLICWVVEPAVVALKSIDLTLLICIKSKVL
jgi:hypothetical protein